MERTDCYEEVAGLKELIREDFAAEDRSTAECEMYLGHLDPDVCGGIGAKYGVPTENISAGGYYRAIIWAVEDEMHNDPEEPVKIEIVRILQTMDDNAEAIVGSDDPSEQLTYEAIIRIVEIVKEVIK